MSKQEVKEKELQDKFNEQIIENQRLRESNTALTKELEWIKNEYSLTVNSLFDVLFNISYQLKKANIDNLYQSKRQKDIQP